MREEVVRGKIVEAGNGVDPCFGAVEDRWRRRRKQREKIDRKRASERAREGAGGEEELCGMGFVLN